MNNIDILEKFINTPNSKSTTGNAEIRFEVNSLIYKTINDLIQKYKYTKQTKEVQKRKNKFEDTTKERIRKNMIIKLCNNAKGHAQSILLDKNMPNYERQIEFEVIEEFVDYISKYEENKQILDGYKKHVIEDFEERCK